MHPDVHVTIIGAGFVGLSCAYWLSKFGVEDIVVVDREKDACGGSSKVSAGVITQNFKEPILLNLAKESVALFRKIPCNMDHRGQVFLYEDLSEIEEAKKTAEFHHEQHLAVDELDTKEKIFSKIPAAYLDDIQYGVFYRGDALADVKKVVSYFKEACEEREVEFMLGTTVRQILPEGERQFMIHTDKGNFNTQIVINAAGAHAGVIGHLAGVDVPVLPMRMHAVTVTGVDEISQRMPIVNDERLKLDIIPYDSGFMLVQQYHHEQHGFFKGVEEHFIHDMLFDAEKRFPDMSKAKIKETMSGYYSMTPDGKPVIGETSLKGFYCVAGFGGKGFTFAPIAGLVMADLLVHPESRHSLRGLGPDRFLKRRT